MRTLARFALFAVIAIGTVALVVVQSPRLEKRV